MPRAVVCHKFGPPSTLVVEDVAPLEPRAGEVVIKVLTSGLDFVATLMIEGRYQRVSAPPFTPGGEVTGVVETVGAGVTAFSPGDLVCSGGGGVQGGFAEQYRCKANSLIPLPADYDVRRFPSLYGYQTSLFALRNRARLQHGETLLVLGAAGGVGITCVEVGKMLGATVIAAASTDEKLAVCTAAGADRTLNYDGLSYRELRDAVRELAPGGVDVVFDPVGDAFTEPCVRNLAEGGRYLTVGFVAGDIPKVPANLLLLRNAQLVSELASSLRRANLE
eukprot:COSAG03_NODE_5035_length_1359_cov_1.294444_1_plen_278_part_00